MRRDNKKRNERGEMNEGKNSRKGTKKRRKKVRDR